MLIPKRDLNPRPFGNNLK
nr:hypothetical protein [Sicyoidochytrium minutum DNA virus]